MPFQKGQKGLLWVLDTRLPRNLGLKKGALFCLKGFIREPKPPKKGIRVLLGILG